MNRKKQKGGPPATLTGRMPVSSPNSPRWARIASELHLYGLVVGQVYTIEDITQMLPPYEDGGRPRPRAAARRLLENGVVELVERGPNGSRGRGATYRILFPPAKPIDPAVRSDVEDETLKTDDDWLASRIAKMTEED